MLGMKAFLLLVVITVSAIALKDGCPPTSAVSCFCKRQFYGISMVCSGPNVNTDDLRSTFENFKDHDIFSLELSSMTLPTAEEDLFQGLSLNSLRFTNVLIDDDSILEDLSFFRGLEDSLIGLTITDSQTTGASISKLKMDHLETLEVIELSGNKIPTIGKQWLKKGPKKLTSLLLNGNGIKSIEDEAFASLSDLTTLWLGANDLTEISRAILPTSVSKLRWIDISNNDITMLPKDLFVDMTNLEILRLDGNLIKTLPEQIFPISVTESAHIAIEGNPLQCDSELKWVCDEKVNIDIRDAKCDSPSVLKDVILSDFCNA